MGGDYSSRFGQWCCFLACMLLLVIEIDGGSIPITIVETAKARGAVCLDGSAPAYHYDKGYGSGINSWIVHMEGGGWCDDLESCSQRRNTYKGSSLKMEKTMGFSGILGGKQSANPDFYNWNRIKIKYCDGSSFTGDVEAVDPKTNLYFRGERVWRAVIDELLAKGMKNAQNAILSGCSAGGLASILHCDKFAALLPPTARVKCVSDAGFFIHGQDIAGGRAIENFFGSVVRLHGSAKNLPASCTSKMRPDLCFFPQYVTQTMQTPLFVINSAYDSWQIKNVLAPTSVDKKGFWKSCKLDLKKCSASQLQTVQGFRTQFLAALSSGAGSKPANGLFINSCHAHCQSGSLSTWLDAKSPVVANTKMGKAVGDWFYGRAAFQKIDCPYPCNPTCVKIDSDS
ncbi:pectin acetylesterase 7 [Mercurialis annua]|uniref:pectin acetylesterase 7 n=1 Tax=Mercurialis annua TaxID=3986 RepID=UPI0021604FE9|nr:pectin acetylesterase 7 [Mercurialis annua]